MQIIFQNILVGLARERLVWNCGLIRRFLSIGRRIGLDELTWGLFDLNDLELRLFLILEKELLMSVGRLRKRLVFELSFLWVVQLGYLLLVIVVLLVLILMLGSYRNRSSSLHSLCIHSFSIIDAPWSLLWEMGCWFRLLCIGFVKMGEQLWSE